MSQYSQDKRITINGLDFHYRDWGGSGRSLVLLHGLASTCRIWDLVAPILSEDYSVVALDQRGHGESAKPEEGYHFAAVAHDLLGFIRGTGLDRPIIAGHSWGGDVALEFSVAYPSAVSGLCFVDGGMIEPSARYPSLEETRVQMAPPVLTGMTVDQFLEPIRNGNQAPHDDAPGGGSYSRQLCRTGGQYNPSSAQPREPHKNHRSLVGAPPSPTVPPGGVPGAAPARPAAQQPRSSGTAGAKGSQRRRCRRVRATEQGCLVGGQRPRRSPATSGVGCQRCTGTHPGRILRLRRCPISSFSRYRGRLGCGESRPDPRVFCFPAFGGKTISKFTDDYEGMLTK